MRYLRIIAHLDMDAFFASIEERNRPHLQGKPIVVGSDPKEGYGRGVVSTANYAARAYGIRSAMPISHAWRASQEAKKAGKPEAVFLPPNFQEYEKSSHAVLEIIKKYAVVVEQASVDEFYFDISFAKTYQKTESLCKKIKAEIKKAENVTCSIGIGPNKLVAKIAAGRKKPDGLFVVKAKDAELFLEDLPIRELPGIGPKTAALLAKRDIVSIRDIKKLSSQEMQDMLGKRGVDMYDKARGIDDSSIVAYRQVKSIGEQNTFERDTFDIAFIGEQLETYCTRVFKRFLSSEFARFKTIALTVRFSDFTTVSCAKSFTPALGRRDLKKFRLEALKLLLPFLDKRKNPALKSFRLIGIRVENLKI